MSPKVSEEYVESRKRDILDAAAACFARAGLHRATMDDICTQAGLSKGAVYGYFKSKDDIVSALKVESVQRDAAIIRSATQSGDPEDAFSAMFAAVLDTVGSGPGGVKRKTDVLTWAESGGPPVADTGYRGTGTMLLEGLVQHEMRGKIDISLAEDGLTCRLEIPLKGSGSA